MISRQIGATLSDFNGPEFVALSPSMTCASRSGRKATVPSRFLSSPTSERQRSPLIQQCEQLAIERVDSRAKAEQVARSR